MTYFLPRGVFFHNKIYIYGNIVGCLQNFSDDREYYKMNVWFVWMIFEQMNTSLQSSLQGRNKNNLKINRINMLLITFCLKNSNFMEAWIKQCGVPSEFFHFFRIFSMFLFDFLRFEIIFWVGMSNEDVCRLLNVVILHLRVLYWYTQLLCQLVHWFHINK